MDNNTSADRHHHQHSNTATPTTTIETFNNKSSILQCEPTPTRQHHYMPCQYISNTHSQQHDAETHKKHNTSQHHCTHQRVNAPRHQHVNTPEHINTPTQSCSHQHMFTPTHLNTIIIKTERAKECLQIKTPALLIPPSTSVRGCSKVRDKTFSNFA